MSKRKTLYLVDGNNNIYRAHHSLRNFTNAEGMATGATYGFTLMLRKLLREENPDFLAVCFDKTDRCFRHELYPEYKANRDPIPVDLEPQLPLIRQVTAGLGVAIVERDDIEADDIIATLATAALRAPEPLDVVVVSTDKDLMQLVGEGCTLFDTMKDIRYGVDEVQTKLGVRPRQVADWLALMGDKVDNIPGVPGIGKKTAAGLLATYDTLDGVYQAIDNGDPAIKGKRRQNLESHREDAYLSRQLTGLQCDLDLGVQTSSLRIGPQDRPVLAELFGTLDFRNFAREFAESEAPGPSDTNAPSAEAEHPALSRDRFELVRSNHDLERWAEAAAAASTLSVALATTRGHAISAQLVGVALATDTLSACYIPVGHTTLEAVDQLPLADVIAALKPLLESTAVQKVVFDTKKALQVLRGVGVELQGVVFDPKLASYLVDPDRFHDHTLDLIARDLLGHQCLELKTLTGTGKRALDMDQLGLSNSRDYFCERAQVSLAARPSLAEQLEDRGLTHLLRELELPLSRVLAEMESHGIAVNVPLLQSLSAELGARASALETEAHELAGNPFKVGSPKQLSEVLFKKLGLPAKKKTKTGYSTDNSVLEELSELHELPAKVIQWRSISKLKSTYTDALPELVNSKTGRIHTIFNQAVAATGRLSSAEPNLQNIPVRTAEGRRIRDTFVASEGHTLLAADYSQIELRVLSHLCGSERMVQAFVDGADIHTRTAAEMFDVTPEAVDRGQRAMAKTINFGVLYGMGIGRLAREQRIPREQAKAFIERYFSRYPKIRQWKNKTLEDARDDGFVQTLMGRIRSVPDLHSRNGMRRSFAERIAINTPVQGSAADIIKTAMVRIAARLADEGPDFWGVRLLLQVHDELVFEVPLDAVDATRELVVEEMEGVVDLDVPLSVSASTGHTWLQAH